jgi:hypothetical protein
MQASRLADGHEKTWVLVLDTGEDPHEAILTFARTQGITAARIMGVGAFSEVTLAFFDMDQKRYQEHPYTEQVEVTSFIGNLALAGPEQIKLHAHVTIARADGSVWGGHFVKGRVRPTLELFLVQSPQAITRQKDDDTGLDLIRF